MGLCTLTPCSTENRVAAGMAGIEYAGERVLRVEHAVQIYGHLRELQHRSELPGYQERLRRMSQWYATIRSEYISR